jgi:hypothetical protein
VFSPCWARNSLLGPIPCWARPAGLLPACPLLPGLLLRRWRRSVAPCGCSTTTLLAPRDGGSAALRAHGRRDHVGAAWWTVPLQAAPRHRCRSRW